MRHRPLFLAILSCFWLACAPVRQVPPPASATVPKIEFRLDQLDANGLRGPAGGKVALSYEFSIPDTEACRREVKQIDPGIQFMRGSPGRVRAGPGECLCIGTSGPGFRQTLNRLAGLPYIKRIIECHFE